MPDVHPPATLAVLGALFSEQLVESLREAADADDRIELHLGHVDDPDLVRAVGEAQLAALPHPEMHNSGSVLAALSLSTPVLVPDNAFNRALAEEVGERWVITYDGPLAPTHLRDEPATCRRRGPGG